MSSQEEKIHSGMYYVIPAQIFEDLDLEDSEKMFYALLSGLSFSNGFCFASDAYLAKRKNVDARTIRKWLEKLEKKGYIRRDTKKNGMYWDRKIFITHSHVNSNNSYERKRTPASNGPTDPHREGVQGHIVSEDTPASEAPPLPPPFSKEKAIPASKEEEEEISKRFRERPKDLPKIKSIKAWRKTVLEDLRSISTSEKVDLEQIEDNRSQAMFWDMSKNSDGEMICAYQDRVEFSCGSKVRIVRYDVSSEEWKKQTRWK